jgi:hypothetical protein
MTAVVAARLASATLLMCCPRAVLRAAGDKDPDRRWLVAARVLGVRHVAQVWVERSGRPRRIEAVALASMPCRRSPSRGMRNRIGGWHSPMPALRRCCALRVLGTKHARPFTPQRGA